MLDAILTTLRNPRFRTAAAWLTGGAALGAVALVSVDGAVNATNTLEFCTSCHEMRHSALPEYQTTVHYANAFGVRATCADCHVPRDWPAKLVHKIGSINEIYHWALGTISTPEKFEAHRAELAAKVWAEMKANDSAECRHCHSVAAMDGARQNEVARAVHPAALKAGSTCIDCHKGIAHKLPDAKKVAAAQVTVPPAAAPATPAADPAAKLAATTLPAPTPSTTQAPSKTPHPPVTDSAACLACHKGVTDQPIRPGQSPDPAKKHPVGIRSGVDCVVCHKTPGQIPGQ
jgi:nitrate/TMAO reductase-like tetraheme cytochrome c subunit